MSNPDFKPVLLPAFLHRPFTELLRGLDQILAAGGMAGLAWILVGLLAGFWIYVPLHELGHAFACILAGGTVTELQVAPLFGGGLLAAWIPWVVAGGEYAGRLSGFDTGGSDWVYLATDLGPFLLTVPGVWLLRRAARGATAPGLVTALCFGAALCFAWAPFLSLTGDAYEIGSILVTQLPPWSDPAVAAHLRGDDLGLRFQALRELSVAPWGGFGLAALLGLIWAFTTYALASLVARWLGQKPL